MEKTIGADMKKAKATTETMLGLIDLRIDRRKGTASITNVYFDEPGDVNVSGNLRRRSHVKHNTNGYSPYRYVMRIIFLMPAGMITEFLFCCSTVVYDRCMYDRCIVIVILSTKFARNIWFSEAAHCSKN